MATCVDATHRQLGPAVRSNAQRTVRTHRVGPRRTGCSKPWNYMLPITTRNQHSMRSSANRTEILIKSHLSQHRLGMDPRRRAVGNAAAAVIIIIAAIMVAAIADVSLTMLNHPTPTQRTDSVSSNTLCNQPAYLIRLASQVEQTQSFAQQSHGLSYILASGNNDSATTGTYDGKPYYSPPKTNLALYSYGTTSTAVCPSSLGIKGVVGALWIHVPINNDDSYNLANMSIYFTPGVFPNSTAITP